jgi:hypothetical protein
MAWTDLPDAPTCPRCGAQEGVIGPGTTMHYARLNCGVCGRFLRWLPKPKDRIMTEPIAPPSTPMMTAVPEPDDVDDPTVPAEVQKAVTQTMNATTLLPANAREDAVLSGFCQRLQSWMQDYFHSFARALDGSVQVVQSRGEALEHSSAQIAAMVAQTLAQVPQTPPYQVHVTAQSPDGYTVKLLIAKPDAGEVVAALDALLPWLKSSGYVAVDPAAAYET